MKFLPRACGKHKTRERVLILPVSDSSMDDWILSLMVWVLLPALLLVPVIVFAFNILAVILLFTWLGFGVFMVNPVPADSYY